MKNQYFADINDYRKYGLLRVLGGVSCLSIGVCWLLTEDDEGNDGQLRAYLSQPARWRSYDTELYDKLQGLAHSGARNVRLTQEWNLIPNASYFESVVKDDLNKRNAYFEAAWKTLESCDLVFFDPDNGIEVESVGRGRTGSSKFVYWCELKDAYSNGHSLLIYQHFPRVVRERFVPFIATRLGEKIGCEHIRGFQTSHVAFLLAVQPQHVEGLTNAISELKSRWGRQIEVWYPSVRGAPTSR